MRFLSVCSGIEAATVAWEPLGWRAVAFSEIEAFPCALLAHHYPDVPNWGDMTRYKEWPDATFDVLCGGTPCQSFSVAGLRAGLSDPRGDLMLTFGAIARKYRPRWIVWENVPGVLSSSGGRDFGAFLGLLGECGYGFAFRILDAQYFGIPQRRRRVFVVGCLGSWQRAAAVLFERHSMQGHPAPSRKAREDVAPSLAASAGKRGGVQREGGDGGLHVVGALTASAGPRSHGGSGLATNGGAEAGHLVAYGGNNTAGPIDVATACLAQPGSGWKGDFESETFITHALTGEGFDASEDGTGRGTPLVPTYTGDGINADPIGANQGRTYTQEGSWNFRLHNCVGPQVRRLTPRECERLQGFPDDYTDVPFRGKRAADGPRYKAVGNSWAVPVVRWIGKRLQAVAELEEAAA